MGTIVREAWPINPPLILAPDANWLALTLTLALALALTLALALVVAVAVAVALTLALADTKALPLQPMAESMGLLAVPRLKQG